MPRPRRPVPRVGGASRCLHGDRFPVAWPGSQFHGARANPRCRAPASPVRATMRPHCRRPARARPGARIRSRMPNAEEPRRPSHRRLHAGAPSIGGHGGGGGGGPGPATAGRQIMIAECGQQPARAYWPARRAGALTPQWAVRPRRARTELRSLSLSWSRSEACHVTLFVMVNSQELVTMQELVTVPSRKPVSGLWAGRGRGRAEPPAGFRSCFGRVGPRAGRRPVRRSASQVRNLSGRTAARGRRGASRARHGGVPRGA